MSHIKSNTKSILIKYYYFVFNTFLFSMATVSIDDILDATVYLWFLHYACIYISFLFLYNIELLKIVWKLYLNRGQIIYNCIYN